MLKFPANNSRWLRHSVALCRLSRTEAVSVLIHCTTWWICWQVLGKSAKPIPVMVLGVIWARKRYRCIKYLFVLMITVGVAVFMYRPVDNDGNDDVSNHTFGFGEFLLVCVSYALCLLLLLKCGMLAYLFYLFTDNSLHR